MQFKKITLFLMTLLCWYLGSAQVILTAETNTPPAEGYSDSIYISPGNGMAVPQGGADMTWDYSGLPPFTEERVVEVEDVSGNSYLPAANLRTPGFIFFQAFETDVATYIGFDEEGIYDVGRVITEASFSLATITGNPDDTFTFIGDTVIYEGRVNDVAFPVTYSDMFNQTRIERTNITLSVAAFGLSNTPVQTKRTHHQSRNVIGYGKIIIPLEDQSPSPPIDVLLMEVQENVVDSFFLAGTLPPQALLDAFGVSQGMTGQDTYYLFYTPNLSAPVADVGLANDGTIFSIFFRPRAADLVSGTQELSLANFRLSPNPIQRGQSFVLQSDQDLGPGVARLLSLDGRVLSTLPLLDNGGNNYQVQVPDHLSAGMYLLQTFDRHGRMFRAEKVIVQ